MEIGVAEIAAAVQRAHRAFAREADRLNAADGRLGDGDTGTMLQRLSAALAASPLDLSGEPAAAFMQLATAGARATGSSLGTLVLTGLTTMGKAARGRARLSAEDVYAHLHEVRDAMLARGNVRLGDKTVIDGIAAVAEAGTPAAAREALERFRDQPNRAGRARLYGEQSRGLDDPGMLAFAIFCETLMDEEDSPP